VFFNLGSAIDLRRFLEKGMNFERLGCAIKLIMMLRFRGMEKVETTGLDPQTRKLF